MGLFSKIWKGIKKTFKKIGKGIKKAFMKFGKFMNKIGIVGQIAMSFILPGIGNALLSTFGKAAGWLASGSLGAVGKAAGWVLGKAVEFGKFAVQGYKTVTGAVTDFIGTAGKFIGGKLGIGDLPNMTLGEAWGEYTSKLTDSFSKLGNAAKEFWDTDIKGAIPGGIAPSTVKNQELSKTPQTPIEEYTMELESQLDLSKPLAPIEDPLTSSSVSKFTLGPEGEMLSPLYQSAISEQSLLGKQATEAVSSAAAEVTAEDVSKNWVETFTGEKTFGDVGRKLAAETRDYAYAAPGKAISSAVQTAGLQGLGLAAKPPGEPGPAWGPRVGFESPSKYYDISQVLQPIQPLSFGDYVNTYAMGGENQGTYLGSGFWESYMQRSLAA